MWSTLRALPLLPLLMAPAALDAASEPSPRPQRPVTAPIPPVRADPVKPAATADNSAAQATSGARLRAGLIEDNVTDPEFPSVVPGSVLWARVDPAPAARKAVTAQAEMIRGAVRVALDLAIEAPSLDARVIISGAVSGLAGARLSDMPAARRGAALEGEPLAGRIVEDDATRFLIELSDDPRDVPNNWRRLTQPAWLDLRLRLADGRTVVLTLEKARAGNDLLQQIAPLAP